MIRRTKQDLKILTKLLSPSTRSQLNYKIIKILIFNKTTNIPVRVFSFLTYKLKKIDEHDGI